MSRVKKDITVEQHWDNVGQLRCVISSSTFVTLHHCHGGSVRLEWGKDAMPGVAQKQSDWLVIPLAAPFHTGQWGIDAGGRGLTLMDWERRFGSQVEHLISVDSLLDYDIFECAGVSRPKE